MTKYSGAFLVAAASLLASANAVELTGDNFDEMTEGKTVFIKFFAPWCGHCKAMAADWDKLEASFEGHDVALIGEVDCTSPEGDEICEQFNVDGFPTLMWGDASGPEPYDGGRDYASLKAFADEYVTKAVCSISAVSECTAEEQAAIAAVQAKSDEELVADAKEVMDKLEKAEDNFESEVEKIQQLYEKLSSELAANQEKVKTESNFKFLQQVMKSRKLKAPSVDGMPDDDDDDDDDDDQMKGEL
eukprot:jgi/Psemu1/238419/estExt_Genewise1.C_1000020